MDRNKKILLFVFLFIALLTTFLFYYSSGVQTIEKDGVSLKFKNKFSSLINPLEQEVYLKQDSPYYKNENITITLDYSDHEEILKNKEIVISSLQIRYSPDNISIKDMGIYKEIDTKDYHKNFSTVDLTFNPNKTGYYGFVTYYYTEDSLFAKGTFENKIFVNEERDKPGFTPSWFTVILVVFGVIVSILTIEIFRNINKNRRKK